MCYLMLQWIRKSQILVWLEYLEKIKSKQGREEWLEHSRCIVHVNLEIAVINMYCLWCSNRFDLCSGYMSPEYAMDGRYSTKSDVFSFGVLLLEIIAGKRNTDSERGRSSPNLIGHVSWETKVIRTGWEIILLLWLLNLMIMFLHV